MVKKLFLCLMGLILLLAWWYPVQNVVRIEPVDLKNRFERFQNPTWLGTSTFGLPLEMTRGNRQDVTFQEFRTAFIEKADQTLKADPEFLNPLLNKLNERGRTYLEPEQWPLPWPSKYRVPLTVFLENAQNIELLELAWLESADVFGSELNWRDKYPLRPYAVLFAAVLFAASGLVWRRGDKASTPSAADSRIGTILACCLGLALSGGAMIAMPHLYGIWGDSDLGFAAFFVGLFLCLSGSVSALSFLGPFNYIRDLLQGEKRLLQWNYTPAEWQDFVHKQCNEERRDMLQKLALIGLVLLSTALVVSWVADALAVMIISGVFFVLVLTAVSVPVISRRRLLRGPFEAHIGLKGLYLGGQTHTWTGFFHSFQSAEVETGQNPCLVIHYFQRGHGGGDILVRVPIPAGKEQEAEHAARELQEAFA